MRIAQRVSAALGAGTASIRTSSTVTPDASAASASLRLAVRSSKGGLRRTSITATPTAEHRTTSAAARSTASGSGDNPMINWRGSTPISAKPAA